MAAVMKALNIACDGEETRLWPKRTAVTIGLTVALGLALILASAVFLAGSELAADVTARIGLGDTWQVVWSIPRWPVIAVILVVPVAALFWAAPNIDESFTCLTAGSVVTGGLWVAATFGLAFYVTHFAGFAGSAYGALGGVLVFIFWLNIMSLILLLGAELDSVIGCRIAAADPDEQLIPGNTPSVSPAGPERVPASSVPRGTYTHDLVLFSSRSDPVSSRPSSPPRS